MEKGVTRILAPSHALPTSSSRACARGLRAQPYEVMQATSPGALGAVGDPGAVEFP